MEKNKRLLLFIFGCFPARLLIPIILMIIYNSNQDTGRILTTVFVLVVLLVMLFNDSIEKAYGFFGGNRYWRGSHHAITYMATFALVLMNSELFYVPLLIDALLSLTMVTVVYRCTK